MMMMSWVVGGEKLSVEEEMALTLLDHALMGTPQASGRARVRDGDRVRVRVWTRVRVTVGTKVRVNVRVRVRGRFRITISLC